ncbi:lysylphosphatidylglycerol synthase transmembrane domain-containing protein [Actinomadura chibensis]|uniref:Flippase-like domain-containing protein n=1 Tax=Actinomadura chibensis TaxID=392828 RepID=A0A5D0NE54_9ACTN|nr:lysylphosphatidylglycerol synthase transmembrane domain-containing protein [Actinomadura chibensis]TYB42676.1 flippase-like domain-containing protein [Actinomadura chibensis]
METITAGADPAAPAGLPNSGGPAATPARARRGRWAVLWALAVALAAAVALTTGAPGPALSALTRTRWTCLPPLVLLSVLHFVLSAVALRGAAGRPIPLVETTLAQFTAAAANRVTPSGLGAVAVNTRYLVCQGLPLPRAALAVTLLQVTGLPADLTLMAAVFGASGDDDRVLDALGRHAARAAGLVPAAPLLIAAGVLLLAAALCGRRALNSPAARRAGGRAVAGLAELRRSPGDVAIAFAASASTTLVLGLAFALSVFAVPDTGAGPADVLPLLAAYLVGATAGAAVPAPGGVGSTEAALVAGLAALGVGTAPALHAVLVFRAVTFWAPVPVGLLTCRTLRR